MSNFEFKYRPDIDGMRAVAVISVVLFHFFPRLCPGGFVGVDVFFVISGYLISRIILIDLDSGRFSYKQFYSRRVRRIFPALLVVFGFCFAAGWVLLSPREWSYLCSQVLSGAVMVSNLTHHAEQGYFDAGSVRNPLIHLWSLGIEEQFYIVWTVVLVWVRRGTWNPLAAIALISGVSFLANLIVVGHPDAFVNLHTPWALLRSRNMSWTAVSPYYNPIIRGWELLAGAALAQLTIRSAELKQGWKPELLSGAGLILLALSMVLFNGDKPFPGWRALMPVLGIVCLIWSGSSTWFGRNVLSNRAAVWVGLISYPLYLWHWPLLSFLWLVNDSDLHLNSRNWFIARLGVLILTTLLAGATYYLWEMPLRHTRAGSSGARLRLLVASLCLFVLLGALGPRILAPRLNTPAMLELERAQDDTDYGVNLWRDGPFDSSEFNSQSKRVALLVGDSHMAHYAPAVAAAIKADPNLASAVIAVAGLCPPLPRANPAQPGYNCPAFYEHWIARAYETRFSTVAISSYSEKYFYGGYPGDRAPLGTVSPPTFALTINGKNPSASDWDLEWTQFTEDLRCLVKAGKRVVLITSSPAALPFDPREGMLRLQAPNIGRLNPISRFRYEASQEQLTNRLHEVANNSGAEVLSPLNFLCESDICPALDEDGTPIYRDDNHIRAAKSLKLTRFVRSLLLP